jgi:hypothetical protein
MGFLAHQTVRLHGMVTAREELIEGRMPCLLTTKQQRGTGVWVLLQVLYVLYAHTTV